MQDLKATKAPVAVPTNGTHEQVAQVAPEVSERIMQELAMRQQWHSYQEMLVRASTL